MICRCVGSSCSIPTLTLIANRTTARQMHTDEALASPDWLHRYIVASSKLPVVAGIDDPGRARFHRTVRIGSGRIHVSRVGRCVSRRRTFFSRIRCSSEVRAVETTPPAPETGALPRVVAAGVSPASVKESQLAQLPLQKKRSKTSTSIGINS